MVLLDAEALQEAREEAARDEARARRRTVFSSVVVFTLVVCLTFWTALNLRGQAAQTSPKHAHVAIHKGKKSHAAQSCGRRPVTAKRQPL